MALSSMKGIGDVVSLTSVEKLKAPINDLATEKSRLHKATKEFESLFIYEMLKTMRKTIPENKLSGQAPMANDLGKETFTQMFDMELARKMASGNPGSISDMLYSSLEKVIESQYEPEKTKTRIDSPGKLPRQPIELENTHQSTPLPESRPIPFRIRTKQSLPINASPKRAIDPIMQRFGRYINQASHQTALDSALIYAVIKTESDGNPRAVSQAGAKGLMQLSDSTVQDYGVTSVFDPKENILAGSRYLRQLIDRFGDLKLALAAYNAGPTNVQRYQGVPPFPETRSFIDKVMDHVASFEASPHRSTD